jgi:hypothetical protein
MARTPSHEKGAPVRLSYAIELVMAVAAGLALERATIHFHRDLFNDIAKFPRWVQYGIYLTEFGDPFCTGLVLVEGAAVWIDTGRRRTSRVWGFGRLTWSVSFCVAILTSLKMLVWVAAREVWDNVPLPPAVGSILRQWWKFFIEDNDYIITKTNASLVLAAFLITSLPARWPRDPSPDAREWAGRIFFGALILLYLTHETLGWYWE